MAKLTGNKILKEINEGNIVISPFNRDNLGPNSYDLTLGNEFKTYDDIYLLTPDNHDAVLDSKKENPTASYGIGEKGYVFTPGVLYLCHTQEVAGSTRYVPCIEGRSSIARLGVQVHLTAGFGDVGFVGQWTLEIIVSRPVILYSGMRICQVYFDTLEGEITELYRGKYLNSVGAIASKSHEDKEYVDYSEDSVLRYCSDCKSQQFKTPSGWTCINGHGGAEPIYNETVTCKNCGGQFVVAIDHCGYCIHCNHRYSPRPKLVK